MDLIIDREIDRIFVDFGGNAVQVVGLADGQVLDVHSSATMDAGGASSSRAHDLVVWNPWVEKSRRMEDFGDNEFTHMMCLEPGRVSAREELPAGARYALKQRCTWSKPVHA